MNVLEIARYKLETGLSDKEIGKAFGVSRSTIVRYLTQILPKTDKNLYEQIMAERKKGRKGGGYNN